MGKKLLLRVLPFLVFLAGLNISQVQAQSPCSNGPANSASATISLQGSNNICSDESISITSSNFNLDGGTGETYQWQVQVGSGSWTDLSGEVSTNLTNYSPVQNNSKFRLAIIFCEGTGDEDIYYSNTSSTITVNTVTTATASISANKTEICPNETINFSASLTNQGGNPSFSWRVNGTERGTASSFSWDQFNDGDSVELWMTPSKACANDGDSDANNTVESNVVNISVRAAIPDTPGTISGPSDVCPNTSATYSVTAVDRATSYIWTLPSGWSGTSTTNSIDISSGAAGNNQTISVRAVNDCGESIDTDLNVNVGPGNPATPSAITGAPSLICEGDEFTVSVTDDPDLDYTWAVPSGWTIDSGQGSNLINVIAGNYGENGTISVYATNSCLLDSDAQSISLTINEPIPAPPGNISGDALVCPGTDAIYNIGNVQYADSYEWILDGNIVSGVTGTSYTFNSSSVGDHTLEVITNNECGSSTAFSKTITVDNGTPGATSISETNGEVNFCPGETGITFSVPTDAKIDNYSWVIPSGWSSTTLSGSTLNEITVTAGQLGDDGQIQFTGTSNDCGSVTATYDVFVKDPAPQIGNESITGETSVCHEDSELTYSIPAIQYATNYIWNVPGNWNITSGDGTNSITVSAGTDDGNITVIAENDCGQSSPISLAVGSIDNEPVQPGTITSNLWDPTTNSNTPICPPATGITFSINPVTGADSYNWILPTGWEITSGEGTTAITVTVTASADYATNESISVEAVNICGNSSAQTYDNITLSDYVVLNAGPDQTVCSTTSPVTINGNVDFNGSKMKIFADSDGSGSFAGIPNGKVDNFSITYTPSQDDLDNLSQVLVTITTEAPVGACGPGEDQMIINFRPDPTGSISPVTEICEGQSAEVNFTGTPNTILTYQVDSGSTQTVNIDDSGNASINTTALNADANIALTSIAYQDAPDCITTLSESLNITVNPVPSVELSYDELCSSQTNSVTPILANGIGAWENGSFSANGNLGANINTDGSFIPNNVNPGTYTVTYTIPASGGCEEIEVTTEVSIYEEVSITSEPIDSRICEGLDTQFEVTTTGEGLTYQWYKGTATAGNEVSGATEAVLSLTNVSAADAGDYLVMVSGTDPCTAVTSSIASLQVDENIVIESQPQSNTYCEGESIDLSVGGNANGIPFDENFSYQWYKGNPGSGTAISGANSQILQITNSDTADSDSYYVEITGPSDYTCSAVTTEAAVIEVRATPTVEISGDIGICDGESAEIFFSNGTSNAIVTYSINGDGNNLQTINLDASGSATLNTGALNATNNTDTNFVFELVSIAYDDATNPCSFTFPDPEPQATITVAANPEVSITMPGDQVEFCTADNTNYTPNLNGTGEFSGGTFSSNGISIDPNTGEFNPGNETAGNYTISYTIPAYGGCAEEVITLDIAIYEEATITSEPSNLGICSTNDAEFSVTATGDDLSYQWYKDGNPISGATSATLSLPVATSDDAGEYYVMIAGTNACTPTESSQVQSETVTLNVDEDIVIIEPAEDVRVCDNTNATVEFKFVVHANGAPLLFEWIYADGTPVNPESKSNMSAPAPIERDASAEEIANHPELSGKKVYEGTLTISGITSDDQASYAVRIDGSGNDFNCPEAVSNSFNLDVDPLPNSPTVEDIEYCLGAEASPLTAGADTGATLTWYDGDGNVLSEAPTPSTDAVGDTSYFVTQMETYCESPQAEIIVTVNALPEVPPLTAEELSVDYCLGETATQLTATADTDHTINWYEAESDTTPLDAAPTPQTTAAGTIDYWVSQTNSITQCEGDKIQITVNINDLPEIVIPEDQTICQGDTFTINVSDNNDTDNSTTYSWNWEGNTGSPVTGEAPQFSPAESTTYTVTATNSSGCTNIETITINVDPQPVAGTLSGPASVCETSPNGELNLTGHSGTIERWEYKLATSSTWTTINEETPDANYQFDGLNETTQYRVVVTNGVCEEVYSNEVTITVDPVPVAGGVLFRGTDRVFMMCEFPSEDYLVPLEYSGELVGEIVAWQYRRNSQTDWTTIMDGGNPFTGTTLSGTQVNNAAENESTLFRVEVQSGACEPNAYSDFATLSIIPSDIAPSPVQITPGEVCLGEVVTMSSSTGYGGSGTFQGGAFDNSSIANHGWRVMRYGGSDFTEYTFESAADNTRPERWMRTNPHEYQMDDPDNPGSIIWQEFDSCSCDAGNKGFAIVSGDNPSTLETPVFNTYTMDNPTLTFDQAYNLTSEDVIRVELSLDGGNTYDIVLMEIQGPEVSGNYDKFGDDGLGEPNNMEIDLSNYAGLDNLRVRWLYDGTTGGIYTIDDIGLPEDPQNVQLIWYYDEDINDPNNTLEQIGAVNQSTVTYPQDGAQWPKIGWNDFEVQTALVFDTNGDPCESAENSAVTSVYVFDNYTSTASAQVGECGNTDVQLSASITSAFYQEDITEFPEGEGSTLAWEIIESPAEYTFSEDHFVNSDPELPAINDPNAVFQPPVEGNYTIRWTITPNASQTTRDILGEMVTQDISANPCPMTHIDTSFEFIDCTTLDFDGVDDYIDFETNYAGNYFIEAWIRPFDRPDPINGTTDASTGTIMSGPGFEIKMEDLPAYIAPNTRWYHIAVSKTGELYVDGIKQTTSNISGVGGSKTIIGARWNNNTQTTENHFSGWIEEVRIWNNRPSDEEIRFMMNQRIQINDAATVSTPIMGEVVPNKSVAGSYLVDGNGNNLHSKGYDSGFNEILEPFYDQTWGDLAGYYRLYSDEPDPDNLLPGYFDNALEPANGFTPDHSINKVPGRLYNITTNQENTSPTPYFDDITQNGQNWETDNTWARPDVWDPPNSNGIGGTPIEWNIARINTNINSSTKNITMLGLLSETIDKELTIESDQFIRISHYLLLDGNMDLVDESQLLQDHGSILAEESAGWLERDQQGRRSSYNYNYWSSPVSLQGSANNSGFILQDILWDGRDPNNPGSINFVENYFAADGPRTNPLTVSSMWIWNFLGGQADIYGDWTHLSHDGLGPTGTGYSMKGTDGTVAPNTQTQNYIFKGKPHNGTIQLNIGNNQNYLVGNPYASAINAYEFLLDNLSGVSAPGGTPSRSSSSSFNGTLYYWDHFSGSTHILEEYIGGYATFNFSGTAPAISNDWRISQGGSGSKEPEQYIPVAQGFFVNSTTESGQNFSGDIIFRNSQRSFVRDDNGEPAIFLMQEDRLKSSTTTTSSNNIFNDDQRAKIRVKFQSPAGYHRQILVTRDAGTTNGFDLGYDAPLIENNIEDMYWVFNDSRFVIQAVPDFEKDQVLPLAIKTKAEGQFTIKIDSTENWPVGKEIFLKDKQLDSIHDILSSPYVGTTGEGENKERFEIVFHNPNDDVVTTDPDPIDPDPTDPTNPDDLPIIDGLVGISYSHFSRKVKISNFDLLEVNKVMIFDMNGKLIQEFDRLPTENEILLSLRPVRSGVYIVKAFCENGVCNKKIVVK